MFNGQNNNPNQSQLGNPWNMLDTLYQIYLNGGGGGGGGGGAVTIVDGGDVTQGSEADNAVTDYTASATLIALVKGLLKIPQTTDGIADGAIATLGTIANGSRTVNANLGQINTSNSGIDGSCSDIKTAIGTTADVAETDPTQSATQISLLKGILTELLSTGALAGGKSLNDVVNALLTNVSNGNSLNDVVTALDTLNSTLGTTNTLLGKFTFSVSGYLNTYNNATP